jgi:hypothetical protein
MSLLLNLRSAPSGALFVGENDGDTVIWDAAARKWKVGPGGGGGAVDSVFGRTGVVVAETGDYDSDQLDNVSGVSGSSVSDALDSLGADIGALDSDQVGNASNVTGTSVSDALDALLTALGVAGLKRGPDLANVDSTISLTQGSLFVLPANTNNASRTYTLDRNGLPGSTPGNGSMIYVLVMDTTAFTKLFVNGGTGGGTMLTIAAGAAAGLYAFGDDGTNWYWPPCQVLVQAI